MKIHIGADHAGFEMKKNLIPYLKHMGYEVIDHGAKVYDSSDDYVDFVAPVAREVSREGDSMGIIIGGSGQGEAIVANKFPNIRATVFNGQYKPDDGRFVPEEICLLRQHNDSNVLSLGARFLSNEEARKTVSLWLRTPFSQDERHKRRIGKIIELEKHIWQK